MNKKALKILFDAFWSPKGWKKGAVRPEDFEFAKSAGVMFDPVVASHSKVVERATKAIGDLTPRIVADGFLASLSNRQVELRSALGSYAFLQFFPEHEHTLPGQCSICGTYKSNKLEDLNVLNFERFKWGGVRHDQPLYASFDLEQFRAADKPKPSASDIEIFKELINQIRKVAPDTTSTALANHLSAKGFKSNKAERQVMVEVLGICGILGTHSHPGYLREFIRYSDRKLPARHFVDMHYPACWWRGSDGLNDAALRHYFAHVL